MKVGYIVGPASTVLCCLNCCHSVTLHDQRGCSRDRCDCTEVPPDPVPYPIGPAGSTIDERHAVMLAIPRSPEAIEAAMKAGIARVTYGPDSAEHLAAWDALVAATRKADS